MLREGKKATGSAECTMANITQEQLIAAMQSGGASAGLVQAMQARLDSLVGRPSGLIETLPKPIQKRIQYLKSLQEEYDTQEEEYEKELDELDKKYASIYEPIFAKRAAIVKGETEAPLDIVIESSEGADTGPAGVPEFWLGVLRANEVTASQITEKDESVLEYLVDIRSEEMHGDDECGFKLTFEFAENPFFANKLLTKAYHMVDSDEPVLERAVGTKIDWKAGKNITIKTLKKKPKPGRGGKSTSSRPTTKIEVVDSFFSFFSPPRVPDEEDENLDEAEIDELQAALEEDYEIGETIRDQLIPNAVTWYTGDAEDDVDDEDEDDKDDDDEEDDDDDEDDEDSNLEDEEDEEDQNANDATLPKKGKQNVKLPSDAKEQPPECKQQ